MRIQVFGILITTLCNFPIYILLTHLKVVCLGLVKAQNIDSFVWEFKDEYDLLNSRTKILACTILSELHLVRNNERIVTKLFKRGGKNP